MKTTIMILLIAFGMKAQTDKDKHFLAGQVISSTVGTAYFLYKPYKPFKACLVGFVAGSIVGIAKEAIYDKRMNLGHCDNEDAYVTIWGSLVGAITLRVGIHEFYGKKRTIAYNLLEN